MTSSVKLNENTKKRIRVLADTIEKGKRTSYDSGINIICDFAESALNDSYFYHPSKEPEEEEGEE